jgi:uncharacterized protein YkwD
MSLRRPIILLVACVAFAAFASSALASSTRAYSSALVQAINSARVANGVAPLQVDARLTTAARGQSSYLASAGKLDHYGPGGTTVLTRVSRLGYHGNMVGEDLAAGMGPVATVRAWMADPAHRQNVLEPRFHMVGVGVATGSLGGGSAPFVTVDFAS